MTFPQPLNIALAGCGTVGSGVVHILRSSSDLVNMQAGRPIVLKHIVVRDPGRSRAVNLDGIPVSSNLDSIITDPEIDTVVHVVGGIEPARSGILQLLNAGKNIVTANKALLYEHGDELFSAARRAQRTISFEAAVAGGIPIISTVNTALTGNRILSQSKPS